MRFLLLAIAGLFSQAAAASAGANAGGTLIVHSVDAVYTSDNSGYCDEPLPRGCETFDAQADGVGTQIWVVLAVFTEANSPRLRGVEFGISYSGLSVVDGGGCGDLEVSMPSWPASGSGTQIVWATNQTAQITQVCWFAGYAYAAAGLSFDLTPHPVYGGHFADDYVPSHLDEIAAYGSLGFGAPGEAPCPEVRTFVIRPDGTGDRPTIQSAIFVAAPGSVILLEDGLYTGPGNRDILTFGSQFTLRSISGNPNACVIDCQGSPWESRRAFELRDSEKSCPTIEGIKIVGGYAGEDFGFNAEGGAVKMQWASALVMKNCIFENCSADDAGGAIDTGGSLELEDCVFIDNSCRGDLGGAVFATGGAQLLMRRCKFYGNSSGEKGGAFMATEARVRVEDCEFFDNDAPLGGGTYLYSADAEFTRCTWAGNEAVKGGALFVRNGVVSIDHSTISENTAPLGSGICGETLPGALSLENTIIAFGGSGDAITCGALSITASSCDVFGNAGGNWPACLLDQSNTNGNFSIDPLFCDRSARNYYLDSTSPCAPGNGPGDGLVGAWPVGCGTAIASDAPELIPGSAFDSPRAIPNPFRELTEIRYAVGGSGEQPVLGQIFDPSGRLVRRLVQGTQPAGTYQTHWDGHDDAGRLSPTGVYFFRLSIGERLETARLLRIH